MNQISGGSDVPVDLCSVEVLLLESVAHDLNISLPQGLMEILFAVLWWPNATREASTALISIAEKNAFIDSSSNILSKFKQIVAKSPKPTQLVGRTAKATCCRCLDLWFLSSMQYVLDKCSWQKVMSSVKRFGPSRFAGLSNSVMVIWPLPSASILPHQGVCNADVLLARTAWHN